jgi:hypothetical protein
MDFSSALFRVNPRLQSKSPARPGRGSAGLSGAGAQSKLACRFRDDADGAHEALAAARPAVDATRPPRFQEHDFWSLPAWMPLCPKPSAVR